MSMATTAPRNITRDSLRGSVPGPAGPRAGRQPPLVGRHGGRSLADSSFRPYAQDPVARLAYRGPAGRGSREEALASRRRQEQHGHRSQDHFRSLLELLGPACQRLWSVVSEAASQV